MYERILLPFDGSEEAAEALHHAGELAHWADATVRVLYVADTTRDSVTVVEGDTVDALVQRGERVVEEAAQTLDTLGVSSETEVAQGNPAPMVAEYAEQYDQDLVVMPTHGREGLSRFVVGSVSEKVVRLSPVPVLTIQMQPAGTLVFPYESVLVPTDGSETARRGAEHSLSLAASLGATVHVLSVVDESVLGLDVGPTAGDGGTEQAATDAVEAVVAEAQERGVADTVGHVEHGTPVDAILKRIESNGLDAVGMATTGRRGTDRILLGSVAEATVRSAPVPVLTVPSPS